MYVLWNLPADAAEAVDANVDGHDGLIRKASIGTANAMTVVWTGRDRAVESDPPMFGLQQQSGGHVRKTEFLANA